MKFGIEVEFGGLSVAAVTKLLGAHFRRVSTVDLGSFLCDVITDNGIEQRELPVERGFIDDTTIGSIQVKRETNGGGIAEDARYSATPKPYVTEVVFSPLDYGQLEEVNDVILKLKMAGAIGTNLALPVSTQINVSREVGFSSIDLADLILHYEEHDIAKYEACATRQAFIRRFHPDFMAFLQHAIAIEDDMPLEYFSHHYFNQNAWNILNDENRLLAATYDPNNMLPYYLSDSAKMPGSTAARVIKYSHVKISSYLLSKMSGPLADAINDYNWVWPQPALEFRVFDTDFNLMPKVDLVRDIISRT